MIATLALLGAPAFAEEVHLEVSTGHTDAVVCAVEDATRRVTLDQDGLAIVWDRASGRALHRWRGPTTGSVQRMSCTLSEVEGRPVFVAGHSGGVNVLDPQSGVLLADFDLDVSGEARVRARGDRLLVWHERARGATRVTAAGTGPRAFATEHSVVAASLLPDDLAVVATSDGLLQRWDLGRRSPRLLAEIALPTPEDADALPSSFAALTGQASKGTLAVGTDGDAILAVYSDGRIWRWSDTLDEVARIPDAAGIEDAAVEDGLVAWIGSGGMQAWSAASGRTTWTLSNSPHRVTILGGRPTALGLNGTVEQGLAEGEVAQLSRTMVSPINKLVVHPDHISVIHQGRPILRWALDGGPPTRGRADGARTAKGYRPYDNRALDVLRDPPVALEVVEPAEPSPTFFNDRQLRLVDLERDEVLHTFDLEDVEGSARFRLLSPTQVAYSGSGGLVLDATKDKLIPWALLDGFTVSLVEGELAVIGSYADGLRVVDPRRRKEVTHVPEFSSMGFDLVGEVLHGVARDGRVFAVDLTSEQLDEETPPWGLDGGWLSQAVEPHGDRTALGTGDGRILVWDGKVEMEPTEWGPAPIGQPTILSAHTGPVTTLAWLDDRLVSGGDDGVTHIWDALAPDESPRCSLYAFSDKTWAIVDRDGRYDASNAGDIPHLHWVVDGEPVALDQLKSRYWHPGLLGACTGRGEVALRDVEGLDQVALHPKVAVSLDDGRLHVSLDARSGGIGPVVVRLNGKEVAADLRDVGARSGGPGDLDLVLDVGHSPLVQPGGDNLVEVFAANADGSLVSRGVQARFQAMGNKRAPRLRALVVGTADYAGEGLDLRFSGRDAVAFAEALQAGGSALFDDVEVTLLSTEGDHPRPTRAAVEEALTKLAQDTRPEDVVIVYFAGHGVVSAGGQGELQLLLADAWTADVSDPAVRERVALSSGRLAELLAATPAGKQVLILDTCHSGKAVDDLTAARAVPGDQVRAMDRMKDRAGLFVLAGASADAVSYEASRFGQGLLTYSLLAGMRGAALREGTLWDVSGLFAYASDRVPDLAKGVGGVQQPVVAVPRGGGSFDIGRVTPEVRSAIHLAEDRPVVLRSNFQDEVRFDDALGLAERVDTALRDRSRGVTAPFVFVDGRGWEGGLVVAGRYRTRDGGVHVDLRVLRDGQVLASDTVTGVDADEVSKAIAATVERVVGGGS